MSTYLRFNWFFREIEMIDNPRVQIRVKSEECFFVMNVGTNGIDCTNVNLKFFNQISVGEASQLHNAFHIVRVYDEHLVTVNCAIVSGCSHDMK
jgi:hypothetical protein